ncbi:hypothetical protein QQF73_06565 [Marinobacter sp. M216]|uniref:Uncharacterized protein n=1 Tax=Marinobacter albus TaxID=3030833 RepID=A0ABT7HCK0_9GAMM|nr:hypothetical protein [Marinobacter sp. M216]MDK9557286.1 hypothetical protein [Marinobacter sp. M216]
MLDLMLGNDDRSFSLGEVHAWFRPFRAHHKYIDCNCGDKDCSYWLPILSVPEKEFHARAFDQLGVDFLVDSSKSLPWVIDNNGWAAKRGIETVNIVMHKPLINYIYSIWKRGDSIDTALYRYKAYYWRLVNSSISAVSVSFSDLVSDPDQSLRQICKITGQAYTPDRKKFWAREHHHIFGSGGIRGQAKVGSSTIQERDDLPEDFLALIPLINEKIAGDKKIQKIKQYFASNNFKTYTPSFGILKSPRRKLKPAWYYFSKAKALWRRFFPEVYEPK